MFTRDHLCPAHGPRRERRGAVADDARTVKCDSAIAAGKPTNKAGAIRYEAGGAEGKTKGNANQQSTRRMRESRS